MVPTIPKSGPCSSVFEASDLVLALAPSVQYFSSSILLHAVAALAMVATALSWPLILAAFPALGLSLAVHARASIGAAAPRYLAGRSDGGIYIVVDPSRPPLEHRLVSAVFFGSWMVLFVKRGWLPIKAWLIWPDQLTDEQAWRLRRFLVLNHFS